MHDQAISLKRRSINRLAADILKVLAYFDLFDYPLTAEEIRRFLSGSNIDKNEIKNVLHSLYTNSYIFRTGNFYSLKDNIGLVERRIQGNDRARLLLKVAGKKSRFLFSFPFVRGIGISGSLSKNFSDVKGDIDYFIITASNRLWIARSFMHLFKKLTFLTGKQHWYCMNYYIDEEALLIEEKNIFTAMEITTLLPFCGNGIFRKFFEANKWTSNYFPDYKQQILLPKKPCKRSWIKRTLEFTFNNGAGNQLDNYLMKVTTRRWRKKENVKKLNIKGSRMGIKTGKHFCKPNPRFLQEKILMRYQNKLEELKEKFDLNFDQEL